MIVIAHRPMRGVHATIACPRCDANEFVACDDATCATVHPVEVDGPAERFLDRHRCDGKGWDKETLDAPLRERQPS